ncbi:MAG: hypothetical protein HY319_06400 [Armatimonadetes bacterium]|nr:hypothetical protein [Armatimonadota bacterium]
MKKLKKFLEARKKGIPEDPRQLCEAVVQEMEGCEACAHLCKIAMEFCQAGKYEECQLLLQHCIDLCQPATPEELPALPQEALAEAAGVANEARQQLQELRKERCGLQLERAIEQAKLPPKAAEQIRKRFADRIFEATELQEAIDQVRELLSLNGAPGGVEQGQPRVQVLAEDFDKLRAALEVAVGYDYAADQNLQESDRELYRSLGRRHSIKAIYSRMMDDERVSGVYGPNALLREATTGDFPFVLGTALTRAMIPLYRELPNHWENLVLINPNPRRSSSALREGLDGLYDRFQSTPRQGDRGDTWFFDRHGPTVYVWTKPLRGN